MIRILKLHLSALLCFTATASADTHHFYIGTYTGGDTGSKGIYTSTFDDETGAVTDAVLVAETPSPSFLAVRPDGKFLYAVNESGEGSVSAFRITDEKGGLEHLNTKSSHGGAPCHIQVSANGEFALFANYMGGNAGVYAIKGDGSLGKRTALVQHTGKPANPRRQKGPHAHCIMLDAGNRFAMVADLGLDKVFVYQFDASAGTLTPAKEPFAEVAPVHGPRHLAIHPSEEFVFVLNEITRDVTTFAYGNKTGILMKKGTVSTLPEGAPAEGSTAEIFVHPNGKFVYASNRGHDSIAVFSVNEKNGELTQIQVQKTGGKTPRSFAIAPGGKFLLAAGQNDTSIRVLALNPETGFLKPTTHGTFAPAPVCILFP